MLFHQAYKQIDLRLLLPVIVESLRRFWSAGAPERFPAKVVFKLSLIVSVGVPARR